MYYARKYCFRNKEPLTARLTLAAAGAEHFMALQHECSSFDTNWYCDLVAELGGVFWEVQEQGVNFPGSEYFICHRGNDRQEGAIGVVRIARGQGGVLDREQCRRRFSVATQMESNFAEAPSYKLRRKAHRVIALMQEQLLIPPDSAPTLCINQYPNLPFLDQKDEACGVKVGSAAPTSGLCQVYYQNVDLHCMRTHVGRHILPGECARDVCGYCGGHDCGTELLRTSQGRLVLLI